MQDQKNLLYKGYPFNKYTHPGPVVSAVGADTSPTHAAGSTGASFIDLVDVKRLPFNGMALVINLPGPFVPSGTSGTATLTFTVTFSDDGTNPVAGMNHVSQGVVFTAAAGPLAQITTPSGYSSVSLAASGYILVFRLPEVRHRYIKVSWATVLATITTMAYGPMTIAIEEVAPDSEATNTIDIG